MALNEYVHKGEFDRRVKLIEEKLKHIDVKFDTRDLEARLEKENQYYVDQLIDDVSSQIVSAETISNEIAAALQEAKEFTTESIENIPDPTSYDGTDIKAMVNYFVNSYNNFAANTLRFNSVFDTDGQFVGKIRPSSIETGALFVGQRSQQLSLSGIEFRVLPYVENSTQGSENYGYLEIVNSEHSKYHFINNNKLQYKTETAIDKGIAGFMLHYGFGTDTKPKVYVIYEQNIQLQTAATGDDDESGFYIYAKIKSSNREYKSISVDSTKFSEEYNNLYVYENSTYKRVAGKKYNAGTTYYKKNPAFGTSPVDLTGTVSEYLTISVTEDIYINDYSSLYTKQNSSYVLETRTAYNSSTTYYIKEEEAYVLNTATTTDEAEIGAAGSSSSNFIATILVSQNQYAYNYDISNGFLTIKLGYISIATTTPRAVVPQTDPVSYYKQRKVDMTYGSTTIDGRLITTGRIEGSGAYFDLDTGQIGGNIQFSATDKTNIIGFIPQTIKEVLYKASTKSSTPSTSGITISNNAIVYDGWSEYPTVTSTNNCIYSTIITYTKTGGVLSNLSKSSVTLIKEFIDLSPYAETNDISYPIEEVVYIAVDTIEKPTLNISGSNNKITYTVGSTTITVEAPSSAIVSYSQNTPDEQNNYNTGWTLAIPTSGRWYYKCIQKYDKKQSDGSKINFSVSKIEYDAAASAIAICYAGTTEISGGLVVTNAMMLKQDSDDEAPVNGGISGVEAFPAFWAGGDEEEAGNVASIRDLYPDENERYDHYSNANIPNVFIDFDGFSKFGDAYVYGDKFNWSINTNELIIGNCKLVWDNDAGMLKFMIGDKSTSSGYYSGTTRWSTFNGIYSTNAISALGANDQQGGGGGGLDVGTMWKYLNGNSTYSGSETTTILGEFLSSNNAGGFLKYSGSGYASWSSIGIGDITSLQNELNGKQSKLSTSGSASSTYAINIGGNAATASKLGTSIVGATNKPIYLNSGVATVCGIFPTLNPTGETAISLNDDLNTYTTPGVFGTTGGNVGSTIAASLSNCPLTTGFKMIVQTCGNDSTYLRQTINAKNGQTFVRTGSVSSNVWTWGDWKHFTTSSTSAVGSATKPVYVNANGDINNCTYSLSSDVNSGTTNKLAYYNSSSQVDDTSIVSDGKYIKIGSTSNDFLQIGDAKISWDSTNGGLQVSYVGNTSGGKAGIYADWISALGANSQGGGSGGMDLSTLWNQLTTTTDSTYGSTKINVGHLGGGSSGFLKHGDSTEATWSSLQASDIPTLSITDKTSGTLSITRGGTGATSAKGAEYNILSEASTTLETNFNDTTRFAIERINPSAANGILCGYRTASQLWSYIKGKVSSDSAVNVSGNAATATILQTTRTINGTNFNGSANITTSTWGTSRNISISDADGTNTGDAVSINGSENKTLKLPSTIKASLDGTVNSYSIASTINSGTANRLAYYSGANAIDDATYIGCDGTRLCVGGNVDASYVFKVTSGRSFTEFYPYADFGSNAIGFDARCRYTPSGLNGSKNFEATGLIGQYLGSANDTNIDCYGIKGFANNDGTYHINGKCIGIQGHALKGNTNYGVQASLSVDTSSTTNRGFTTYLSGTPASNSINMGINIENVFNAGTNYGIRALVSGATSNTNYAVYASATSGTNNWGIYSYRGKNYFYDSVGIGTTNPPAKLSVAGDIYASGGVTALQTVSSDKRLKKNIKKFNAKDIIDKLNPVSFEWNSKAKKLSNFKDGTNYGLIAQDSDGIIDNLVFDLPDGKGYKGVRYEKLIPILLQAIKEQQKEINELKKLVRK